MAKKRELKKALPRASGKGKSIGLLGGGQLSMLMALKAREMAVKAFVLSPSEKDPSAQNSPLWLKGDPKKPADLRRFFRLVDIITFESEFFPAKAISRALKGQKARAAPPLKAFALIQDRLTQKKLLIKNQIPTADFIKADLKKSESQKQFLIRLWEKLGPFALKSRTGGYDGHGTFIIKKKSQIRAFHLPKKSFIAEKFIPFKRELALLTARNKKGQIAFFPLAETFQKNSICLWLKGPAKHKKLTALKNQIKGFLKAINYQGLMAFELFDTGEDLTVNELAPRVHNSGHYSLDALSEDQFTAHLKAIMNKPLAWPKAKGRGFAMLNLLGEGSKKPLFKIAGSNKTHYLSGPAIVSLKGARLYWYGKSPSRKGRKMGHLNAVAGSPAKALAQLLKARALFKV